MDIKQISKSVLSKVRPRNFSNQSRKEANMSTKSFLRIVIAAGLLALVLLFVQVLSSVSAPASNLSDSMTDKSLIGSDWIERHPSVARPANYYFGSDWIERHPAATQPANYYTGSDWIERHPAATQPTNYYTGSDWIERHPSQPTP
jgi:hypothetical protein